jgi:hypothetical protein
VVTSFKSVLLDYAVDNDLEKKKVGSPVSGHRVHQLSKMTSPNVV